MDKERLLKLARAAQGSIEHEHKARRSVPVGSSVDVSLHLAKK